jgi:hypothetical protein
MTNGPPEYDLAALVRQYVRAANADDQVAAGQMFYLLARDVEGLFVTLLAPAQAAGSVHVWFDGIGGQQVTVIPPFGLEILGSIACCGGSDDCFLRQPFTAEIRAAADHSSLESFVARFGDRERLVAKGIIACAASDYVLTGYRVRIGSSVPFIDGQLVQWAFEFTKSIVPG